MTSSSRRRGPGWSRFSTRLGIPSREDAGPFPGAWSLALCARLRASPPPPGHGWLDSGAPDRAHRLQTAETLAGLSPAGYAENSRNAWSEKPGQVSGSKVSTMGVFMAVICPSYALARWTGFSGGYSIRNLLSTI